MGAGCGEKKYEPLVKYETRHDASIDAYGKDIGRIWRRNKDDRSVLDIFLHVYDHASRISRAACRQRPADAVGPLADTAVWMFSLLAQCQGSRKRQDRLFACDLPPSDIIWNKYPGTCPACFDNWLLALLERHGSDSLAGATNPDIEAALAARARRFTGPDPCTCVHPADQRALRKVRPDLDKYRLAYAGLLRQSGHKVTRMADLERMFGAIYGGVDDHRTFDFLALHLAKELGKTAAAVKDCYTYDDAREPFSLELHALRRQHLQGKIADVFAWLFTLARKVGVLCGCDRHFLTEALWQNYGTTVAGSNWDQLKCPRCQSASCDCARDLKIQWSACEDQEEKPMVQPERDLVFISYAHKDAVWLDRLTTMLKPLVRNHTLSTWDDRMIRGGDVWPQEIASALGRAQVAVLLVTKHFLASDFIADKELPPLLDAAEVEGTRILWIPVGSCLWEDTELGRYQAAANPARPLEMLTEPEQNAVLKRVCGQIRDYVLESRSVEKR